MNTQYPVTHEFRFWGSELEPFKNIEYPCRYVVLFLLVQQIRRILVDGCMASYREHVSTSVHHIFLGQFSILSRHHGLGSGCVHRSRRIGVRWSRQLQRCHRLRQDLH